MTTEEQERRALSYAKAIVSFQNIGSGPDRNLDLCRKIVSDLQYLCKDETGIELENYPTSYIRDMEIKYIPQKRVK